VGALAFVFTSTIPTPLDRNTKFGTPYRVSEKGGKTKKLAALNGAYTAVGTTHRDDAAAGRHADEHLLDHLTPFMPCICSSISIKRKGRLARTASFSRSSPAAPDLRENHLSRGARAL
jgi:hypothetical protein